MLRTMIYSDLPVVFAIETAAQLTPWTQEIFKKCMEAGYRGWVVEQDDTIQGFIILSVAAGECHILNLCVYPGCQRQGIAKQLLQHALEKAAEQGAMQAYLEVRCSNQPAIALYKKFNFKQIAVRKEYYSLLNGREDGWVFEKNLGKEHV